MNELHQILRAAHEEINSGRPALMATLVKADGSTYRRPGARMLLTEDGWAAGSISGGCLEGDVIRKAWWRTENGPAVVTYDSTSGDNDEEIAWGLGCNGVVEALMERLIPESVWPLHIVARWLEERRTGVIVTIIRVTETLGASALRVGQRLTMGEDGEIQSDIFDFGIRERLRDDAKTALAESGSAWRTYPLADGGTAEAFLEIIEPPLSLLIFGAGHDAVPLARLAKKQMGWRVTVVDTRAVRPRPERFPEADEVLACNAADAPFSVPLRPRDAVVLMTHSYHDDLALIGPLLASEVGYLGILGPRSRTERLLRESHASPGAESFAHLHAPIGLDIGADTPEAIALSIVAEIQAVVAGRDGGMLRARPGPIHSREAAPQTRKIVGEALACPVG